MSYAATKPTEPPGKKASAVLALTVHVLLAAFLFYGINWQTRVAPTAVEVELVPAQPAAPTRVTPPTEYKRTPEPRIEPKPEPKIEAKPRKADIELKEKPTPKPPEKKPIPKPPEKKPTPKPPEEKSVPKPVPQAIGLPVDTLQRQLDQDLAKAAQSKLTDDAAAKELAAVKDRQAVQGQATRSRSMADYEASIRGKIKGNIVLPPELKGNPVAVFVVTQLPSGEILQVQLDKPSGIRAYDDAIERAIRKSSPLPKPKDPSLFQRNLKLTFCPDEERGCQ